MTDLLVHPHQRPLSGSVTVNSDKSISHRAVLLSAIADGPSTIHNWLASGDTMATLEAVRALGIKIEVDRVASHSWELLVHGRGLHGLQQPSHPLDCRNAGTCIRLLAGILAGQKFESTLDGSEQLRSRPMSRVTTPLNLMGADIRDSQGHAPLFIAPARLKGIDYHLPVASAQVKSALLLAGLYTDGETRLSQPGPSRDHTERMLRSMGLELTFDARTVLLPAVSSQQQGERYLRPMRLDIPGDISSAAFLLAAAAVVPGSKVTIRNVGVNPTRTGIVDLLQAMRVPITLSSEREINDEPVAAIHLTYGESAGIQVSGSRVVRAIDELPVWAVVATQAAGHASLQGAAELRLKEVDRIAVLCQELNKMGAALVEESGGFSSAGPRPLQGATVNSHGDHRIAMAQAIAGLVASSPTLILGADCIADSYPAFVETLNELGASLAWQE